MFFSTELLSRRDSGFGLLWLAATLGAKSSFKKLPKRSVLTADISQLCDLIAEPAEPLALRLSSNLMVGVVRVYKVKQEIFMTDVTTCFHSLKKAVQELQSMSASAADLQMGQPSVRPDVVTLAIDPGAEYALDLDPFAADWEDYIDTGKKRDRGEETDEEYGSSARKKKQKGKQKPSLVSEDIRADLHTLPEHHEHFLSGPFDLSFGESGLGAAGPSSSQAPGFDFSFDDNFLGIDTVDLGEGVADELARELGEGWGMPADEDARMDVDDQLGLGASLSGIGMNSDLGKEFELGGTPALDIQSDSGARGHGQKPQMSSDKENLPPSSHHVPERTPRLALTPIPLDQQVPAGEGIQDQADKSKRPPRKPKRARLLLDRRTELTDEELQVARANYLEGQEVLRRELELKQLEKTSGKIIEDMIWGVPLGLQAPALRDFWTENFKAHVEARSGAAHGDEGAPPTKRQRTGDRERSWHEPGLEFEQDVAQAEQWDLGYEAHMEPEQGVGADVDDIVASARLRSSEEPDVARRASRPSSAIASFLGRAGEDTLPASQKSSLFPWDNAGPSSSFAGFPGSERISIDRASIGLRASQSRIGSPLVHSRVGSAVGGIGESPLVSSRRASQLIGEDFQFEIPGDTALAEQSQMSDMNLITLERNSLNFLEYAKMQLNTLPPAASLTFEDVVPRENSTPHVAAAAFYHCLVLATKDLLSLDQPQPYRTFKLFIK